MIIIQPHETGNLPSSTALQPVEYHGQGSALERAGGQIARTSNNALQYSAMLNLQLAKVEATQGAKTAHSKLQNQVDENWQDWDKYIVQKGTLPETAIQHMSDFLDGMENDVNTTYADEFDRNPFLKEKVTAAFEDVKTDTLTKARAYARTQFLEIGRRNTQTIASDLRQNALAADARGDLDGYTRERNNILDLYAKLTNGLNPLFNKSESDALVKHEMDTLDDQRVEQIATNDPYRLLDAHKQGALPKSLSPKRTHELIGVAYTAIHQEEGLAQQHDTLKKQQDEDAAKKVQQDFYARSVARDEKGDRAFTTQALLDEASASQTLGDKKPPVITYLQARLDHEKSGAGQFDGTRYKKEMLPAIYSGKLGSEMGVLQMGADYLDATHMTQAISEFQKYRGMVTDRIKQDFEFGERSITGTFALPPGASIDPGGVLDAKVRALDRFHTWYTSQVELAAKKGPQALSQVDIQAQARAIRDEEYAHLQDNLIPILEAQRSSLRYNSAADVKKAHANREITDREANLYLQQIQAFEHLQELSTKRLTAPKGGNRVSKD